MQNNVINPDLTLNQNALRHDWTNSEIEAIFDLSFNDLLLRAQTVHRQHFNPNEIQACTLLSVKTGSCPEDCSYCPQSAHYNTQLEKESLLSIENVISAAKKAKAEGATRFCMGAAWRSPPKKAMPKLIEMIKEVNNLGLETCVTAGMLDQEQTEALAEAGLDYYNHNLDTSPEFYKKIITTRTYQQRLETLKFVRKSNINVCCGGIIGMGESRVDRAELLLELANLTEHPGSVPINMLVKVKGTPMENEKDLDYFEFVRTIAVARIIMPKSYVRLSAGREEMPDAIQALCFFAGANSIFYGDKLLTTSNPGTNRDKELFARLGVEVMSSNKNTNKEKAEVAA